VSTGGLLWTKCAGADRADGVSPRLRSSATAHDDGAADSDGSGSSGAGLVLPTHHVSYSRREAAHLQVSSLGDA
jgi:hypothetical protein